MIMDEQAYEDIGRTVDKWLRAEKLPQRERVEAALTPGRTLLFAGDPQAALWVFNRVSKALSPGTDLEQERYMALANRAYAHNAIARDLARVNDPTYRQHAEQARDLIWQIRDFEAGRPGLPKVFAAWHAMALAEAYRLLGDEKNSRAAVRDAASIPGQLAAEVDHFMACTRS
jgi:hypothetical protein